MSKLKKYLKEHGIKYTDFATHVGLDASVISRLNCGKYKPGPKVVRRIFEATNGKVTPNDLYGLGDGIDQR